MMLSRRLFDTSPRVHVKRQSDTGTDVGVTSDPFGTLIIRDRAFPSRSAAIPNPRQADNEANAVSTEFKGARDGGDGGEQV